MINKQELIELKAKKVSGCLIKYYDTRIIY